MIFSHIRHNTVLAFKPQNLIAYSDTGYKILDKLTMILSWLIFTEKLMTSTGLLSKWWSND